MKVYTLEISIDDYLSIVDDLAIFLRKYKQNWKIYTNKLEWMECLLLWKDYKIVDNYESNIKKINDELQNIIYNIRWWSYDSIWDIASDIENILYIPHIND